MIPLSGIKFQTMPSQVALSSVFKLPVNILGSAFNYLDLFECIFLQVQLVYKDDFYVPFVSVYVII